METLTREEEARFFTYLSDAALKKIIPNITSEGVRLIREGRYIPAWGKSIPAEFLKWIEE